jgi:transposase
MEKTNPETITYVGLDVSRDRLGHAIDGGHCRHVASTQAGRRELCAAPATPKPAPRVICEAGGGYERPALAVLLAAGIDVCLVNPGRVRAFTRAGGLPAKTGGIDAAPPKRSGEKMQPRSHAPMQPETVTPRELLEYRRTLGDQLAAMRNRRAQAGEILRALLDGHLRDLGQKPAQIERRIEARIDTHPTLRGPAAWLRQLQGVGPVPAATLPAYVPEPGQIDDKPLCALVGVAPYARDSGASRRPRHAHGGRAAARHVLHMAAVCAARCNPVLRAFYQRLRDTGRPAALALTAVMRKMPGVLNRLLADPLFSLVH